MWWSSFKNRGNSVVQLMYPIVTFSFSCKKLDKIWYASSMTEKSSNEEKLLWCISVHRDIFQFYLFPVVLESINQNVCLFRSHSQRLYHLIFFLYLFLWDPPPEAPVQWAKCSSSHWECLNSQNMFWFGLENKLVFWLQIYWN